MTLLFFYDTETTGIPNFKEPSEHPDQPHIIQIAAALVDDETRKKESEIDLAETRKRLEFLARNSIRIEKTGFTFRAVNILGHVLGVHHTVHGAIDAAMEQ